MHPHPYPQLRAVGPFVRSESALRIGRRHNRILRTPERHEERVALRVDLLSVVLRERGPQDAVVVSTCRSVALTELLQQSRRALDVGKEEGDRSMRKLGHAATSVALWKTAA